jgi:NTE family protein
MACLATLLGAHDAYHLDDERVTQRTIFVDTMGVDATDFDIDAETQHKLFQNGTLAAESFVESWPPPGFTPEGDWKGGSAG